MKSKTTKGDAAAKRARMIQDKKLRYFMENRVGEFRLRVIPDKKQKKLNPRNIIREDDYDEEQGP